MRYALAVPVLFLLGCATIQKENALQSWIGLSSLDLVQRFGYPQAVGIGIVDDSESSYIYRNCYQETYAVANAARSLSNGAYAASTDNQVAIELHQMNNPGIPPSTRCENWSFVVREGIIVRDSVGALHEGENRYQPFRFGPKRKLPDSDTQEKIQKLRDAMEPKSSNR